MFGNGHFMRLYCICVNFGTYVARSRFICTVTSSGLETLHHPIFLCLFRGGSSRRPAVSLPYVLPDHNAYMEIRSLD